jgi:hypothetical protein
VSEVYVVPVAVPCSRHDTVVIGLKPTGLI